jgi:superfamily II DNA or RNA helicase
MLTLRPYQTAAIDAVRGEFLAGRRSTVVVLPTGTGKTVVFAEVARRSVERGRRVLVIAHRGELLEQAAAKLAAVGVKAAIEKAALRAGDAPVVVASVQTLKGARLASWAPDAFRLVVVDEAHHAPAAGYRAVLDHFAGARILGVTATPDRLDGQGLGSVFESVAYRLELRQAIRDGWLAPLRARRVEVDGVDLADVRTRAGDLDRAELAAVMAAEEALHGVAAPLVELVGDRRTILFAVDVAHARGIVDVLCRYRPGVARVVDGTATPEERAAALADFRAGRFQVLVNCEIFTEGFDEPTVSCVAIARPTKSRALYAQMVGRGTRLAPGKADCLVLDFAGNVGRHRLVGPADVLAGAADLAADVRAEVEAMLGRGEQLELGDVLDQADLEVSRRRSAAAVTAVARYQAEEIDPFVGALPAATGEAGPAATDARRAALAGFGLDDVPAALARATAGRWLDALAARRRSGLSTLRQARLLRRRGYDARDMTFEAANRLIGSLAANGWRRPVRGAAPAADTDRTEGNP